MALLYFLLLEKQPSFFKKTLVVRPWDSSVPLYLLGWVVTILQSLGPWEEGLNRGIREALEVGRGGGGGSSPRGQGEEHSSILCQTLALCMGTQRDYVNTGLKI